MKYGNDVKLNEYVKVVIREFENFKKYTARGFDKSTIENKEILDKIKCPGFESSFAFSMPE